MVLDEVFEEKEKIASDIKVQLTKSMSGFGYIIIQALVNDIDPDIKVKNAMNEINAAQRMRLAAAERAEAEKVAVVKAAEAEAEAKYLQGNGIARQRQAIINGLRESVRQFSDGVQVRAGTLSMQATARGWMKDQNICQANLWTVCINDC